MTDESNSYVSDYEDSEEAKIKEESEIARRYGMTREILFETKNSSKDIHDPRNSMNLSLDDLR